MIIPPYAELQKQLEAIDITKTLTEKEKSELLKSLKFIYYKRGETIYKQGRPINEISILMSGLAKISIENDRQDKTTIISIQGPISFLGTATLFEDVYGATSEAMNDAIVAIIDKKAMLQILNSNAKFATAMLKINSKTIKRCMRQIADFGQKQIKARIACVIWAISDLVQSDFIDIQISRNELADYAGISTGSAIRLLSDLEKAGVVVLDKKTIDIKNKEELIKIALTD